MNENDILYQKGNHWVVRSKKKGYEVIKLEGNTHGKVCAWIGYTGEEGLERAKQEVDRREIKDREVIR
jgi:hypothetical protein